MLAIAISILLAGLLIAHSISKGFRLMAKTVTDAAADLSAAVAAIAATIASDLQLIADSISQHIANGTAVDAIEGQVGKLNDLNSQLVAGVTPEAPPADTVASGGGDDTVAGAGGDDTVSG